MIFVFDPLPFGHLLATAVAENFGIALDQLLLASQKP
jgi:hypothetical protein